MRSRGGEVAVIVAMAAALVLALVIALSGNRVDLDRGTYVFTEPATDCVDEHRVLVQNGVVTDVWISEDDRALEYYGYTPNSPAAAFQSGDESAETTVHNGTVSQCWFVGTDAEHCTGFADVERVGAAEAARMSAWAGLADGAYDVTSRSVTWDESSHHSLMVSNGVAVGAGGEHFQALVAGDTAAAHPDWVRYWIAGSVEPFAVCFDDPDSYDEEGCFEWRAAS